MDARYDTIGRSYSSLRRADPRIATMIEAALGPARTVLNVGAGTGSYEPPDRDVTALEPSAEMIGQRPPGSAPVIQGSAEDLPFADDAFDASMAILTVHHWSDRPRGLAEMRRVTRGPVVLLTFDPYVSDFWLCDYVPEIAAMDKALFPRAEAHAEWLGPIDVRPVPIPEDCLDGFLCAYWRRPFAYLDPDVRASISSFWAVGDVSVALARLERDLLSGAWAERYSALEPLDSCDLGYRLVVSA